MFWLKKIDDWLQTVDLTSWKWQFYQMDLNLSQNGPILCRSRWQNRYQIANTLRANHCPNGQTLYHSRWTNRKQNASKPLSANRTCKRNWTRFLQIRETLVQLLLLLLLELLFLTFSQMKIIVQLFAAGYFYEEVTAREKLGFQRNFILIKKNWIVHSLFRGALYHNRLLLL